MWVKRQDAEQLTESNRQLREEKVKKDAMVPNHENMAYKASFGIVERYLQAKLKSEREKAAVAQQALAAAKEALEKCQRTFETIEKLKGYKSHGPQGEELDILPNIVLQSCIQIASALARIAECEKETT